MDHVDVGDVEADRDPRVAHVLTETFVGPSLPLYFGLGDDTAVNRVEVRWPSGRTQAITQEIKLNDTLRIREPR